MYLPIESFNYSLFFTSLSVWQKEKKIHDTLDTTCGGITRTLSAYMHAGRSNLSKRWVRSTLENREEKVHREYYKISRVPIQKRWGKIVWKRGKYSSYEKKNYGRERRCTVDFIHAFKFFFIPLYFILLLLLEVSFEILQFSLSSVYTQDCFIPDDLLVYQRGCRERKSWLTCDANPPVPLYFAVVNVLRSIASPVG